MPVLPWQLHVVQVLSGTRVERLPAGVCSGCSQYDKYQQPRGKTNPRGQPTWVNPRGETTHVVNPASQARRAPLLCQSHKATAQARLDLGVRLMPLAPATHPAHHLDDRNAKITAATKSHPSGTLPPVAGAGDLDHPFTWLFPAVRRPHAPLGCASNTLRHVAARRKSSQRKRRDGRGTGACRVCQSCGPCAGAASREGNQRERCAGCQCVRRMRWVGRSAQCT